MTTLATPVISVWWTLAVGDTRSSRGVRSWIRNGSTAPASWAPGKASSHSTREPSGRSRWNGSGPRTGRPHSFRRSHSDAKSLVWAHQAHGPPSDDIWRFHHG